MFVNQFSLRLVNMFGLLQRGWRRWCWSCLCPAGALLTPHSSLRLWLPLTLNTRHSTLNNTPVSNDHKNVTEALLSFPSYLYCVLYSLCSMLNQCLFKYLIKSHLPPNWGKLSIYIVPNPVQVRFKSLIQSPNRTGVDTIILGATTLSVLDDYLFICLIVNSVTLQGESPWK